MSAIKKLLCATMLVAGLSACATRAPMPTVESVDLSRFMGDWYVIGLRLTRAALMVR